MMNQQPRVCAASPAAETVAPNHPLAQATEKAQGMLPPVVAGAAAAEPLQLDGFSTLAQQGQLPHCPPIL
jgi:hypothetical protein